MRLYRQKAIEENYQPVKFGGHRHCKISAFSLSRDIVLVTLPAPFFQSHLIQILEIYLLAKFGDHRNVNINSYIRSYMDTFENAGLTASIRHIARF